MSEIAVLTAVVKTTLQDLAKQAKALGVGLETAAPAGRSVSSNHSVLYLLSVSEALNQLAIECERLLPSNSPPLE